MCFLQVNDELCQLMGTQCDITRAYHQQSNGLDESFNQTLQRQLLKFVDNKQNQWDLYLDAILFSYCISKQDSTKYSPFFVYGRNATRPLSYKSTQTRGDGEGSATDNDGDEGSSIDGVTFEKHFDKMTHVRKMALINISRAQERQKKYYDVKHCKDASKYQVGAMVLLKNCKKTIS